MLKAEIIRCCWIGFQTIVTIFSGSMGWPFSKRFNSFTVASVSSWRWTTMSRLHLRDRQRATGTCAFQRSSRRPLRGAGGVEVGAKLPEPSRDPRPEIDRPAANGLVADVNPAGSHQLFNIAKAEAEAEAEAEVEVESRCLAYYGRREAGTFEK